MSQEEVLKFLKKKEDLVTTEEIADGVGISIPAAWRNLLSLLRELEVERIKLDKKALNKLNLPKGGRKHYGWRISITQHEYDDGK